MSLPEAIHTSIHVQDSEREGVCPCLCVISLRIDRTMVKEQFTTVAHLSLSSSQHRTTFLDLQEYNQNNCLPPDKTSISKMPHTFPCSLAPQILEPQGPGWRLSGVWHLTFAVPGAPHGEEEDGFQQAKKPQLFRASPEPIVAKKVPLS